jgi:drug/metabolite transporter (DMT)-like permease
VLLFYWLLKREKSGEATSFLYLVPAVTAIAAVPILGQALHPLVIAGLLLALAGTTMVAGGDASGVPEEADRPSPGVARQRDGREPR